MSSTETENSQNIEQILDNFCEDKFGEHEIVGPQWWSNQTDIVISGISGRFPDAENMKEFMEKLFDGVDMITEDNKRWDPGFYDLPKRHGKLKDLTKFDASFFGMSQEQATVNDPQLNLLLETAYEAIYDSGFDPFSFRGSKTGVYVGNSPLEIASVLLHDWERVNQYTFTGTSRTMLANQLSYCFDFKGPSITFDTACSSTMLALQNAVDAIRKGECDAALVAGAHLTLIPTSAVMFLKLGMLSPQGMCQTFDAKGDGYVRSECVGCVFIQKSTVARRCYATIVHAKSNTDGYKQQGITFPSAQQQATLLKETYKECGIDPNKVTYIEAHGTGTKVGDVIEGSAITAVLAKNREKSPLLIGSVKSNAGHAESASGIMSLAKVIIALETGMIPHNLHYQEPNVYIPSLTDGRLKVVRENTKWSPDIVGINSFGFGGSNTHIVLKPNYKTEGKTYFDKNYSALPLFLVYSGRTENGLKNVFEKFLKHSNDFYFYNMLLQQSQSQRPDLFPYKGYMLLNKDSMGAAITVVHKQIKRLSKCDVPPIYLSFCGFSSLPKTLLKKFCRLEIFHQSFQSCLNDIASLRTEFNNAMKCFLEIVGFQIAFIDVLKHLGVTCQGVIGVCYQEILAKYASCLINRRQTILVAFEFAKHFFGGNKSESLEYTTSCYSLNQIISRLPVEVNKK